MSTGLIVLIIVAVVALIAVAAVVRGAVTSRRRRRLERHFGDDYQEVVDLTGDADYADSVLQGRPNERQSLDIRPLDPVRRDLYSREWQFVQAQFVDAPEKSVSDADALVARVMRECGYPVDDFEHRADLVSVDHPHVVRNYREAHDIFVAFRDGGSVSTEEARQAMVAYRALFSEILGTGDRPADLSIRRAKSGR